MADDIPEMSPAMGMRVDQDPQPPTKKRPLDSFGDDDDTEAKRPKLSEGTTKPHKIVPRVPFVAPDYGLVPFTPSLYRESELNGNMIKLKNNAGTVVKIARHKLLTYSTKFKDCFINRPDSTEFTIKNETVLSTLGSFFNEYGPIICVDNIQLVFKVAGSFGIAHLMENAKSFYCKLTVEEQLLILSDVAREVGPTKDSKKLTDDVVELVRPICEALHRNRLKHEHYELLDQSLYEFLCTAMSQPPLSKYFRYICRLCGWFLRSRGEDELPEQDAMKCIAAVEAHESTCDCHKYCMALLKKIWKEGTTIDTDTMFVVIGALSRNRTSGALVLALAMAADITTELPAEWRDYKRLNVTVLVNLAGPRSWAHLSATSFGELMQRAIDDTPKDFFYYALESYLLYEEANLEDEYDQEIISELFESVDWTSLTKDALTNTSRFLQYLTKRTREEIREALENADDQATDDDER